MLWEAEVFEDLYGAKAESDLTKTQTSWVNNKQTNLQQLHYKFVLVSTNENQGWECLCCVLAICDTVLKT